ncbi:MAG: SCO family protein [Alphaproteobacteria bacterium]|nr:SCO family protein [Alphaproteobacteria bacterium]
MKYFFTITIIAACIGGGIYLSKMRNNLDTNIVQDVTKTPEPSYIVTANVPLGGPFNLTNHLGQRVSNNDFKDKLMLLYFGYSYCPDLCPSELSTMTKALDILGDKINDIKPIFVNIDPKRHTEELLKNYVSLFHPKLMGLYGNDQELNEAFDHYKIYAAKTEDKGGDDYLMDHSTFTYLVGRDGKLISMFRLGTPATEMAKEIEKHF